MTSSTSNSLHSTFPSPMATAGASRQAHHGNVGGEDANGSNANDMGLSSFPDSHQLARRQIPSNSSAQAAMVAYRAYRDSVRRSVLSTYNILGFLSSGTYGRVYKARLRSAPTAGVGPGAGNSVSSAASPHGDAVAPGASPAGRSASGSHAASSEAGQIYAIKKFKPDSKESEASHYTGISQSAMREIALNRELDHVNVVSLREVRLEDKAIYMVFEYAEHDLLQLIHHHSAVLRAPIAPAVLKSILWQLLNGVAYLHRNWVLHRDLKPANILVTNHGVVKIGDLGLARLYGSPLQSLYTGDKVVVTIWYRAPELLLGARHYTTAIDMWAIGCIWGELLALRPMFKGEEAKMDPKTKAAPFQTDQLKRIVEILGSPNKERWPAIETMPDYKGWWPHLRLDNFPKNLHSWYTNRARQQGGYDLFDTLLQYDPTQRLSASDALTHRWFTSEEPLPTLNAFSSLPKPSSTYPTRRVIQDDLDPKMKATFSAPPPTGGSAAITAANPGGTLSSATLTRAGTQGHVAPLGTTGAHPTGSSRASSHASAETGPAPAPNITITGAGSAGSSGAAPLPGANAKGGMVATAAANASRSKRQKLA